MIDYASPLFVDIVLYTVYTLLVVAVGLTAWSVAKGWKADGRARPCRSAGGGRTPLLTAVLPVVTLAVTWLLGSDEPLTVNGQPYTNAFWLKTSDMLIDTSAVLMAVLATVAVLNEIRRVRR